MAVNKVEYAGKVLLDLTEDTVTADMMESGAKAHDKTGALITGSIPVNSRLIGAIKEEDVKYSKEQTDFGTMQYININPRIYPSDKQEQIILRGDQQRCNMNIPAVFFGNASPPEVKKGVTFTSLNGLKLIGTADMSGGGGQVKTGTTTSTTISTGLSKIDKLIIYAESISGKGAVDIIYTGESEAVVTYCSYYSNYSRTCAVQKRSAFGVSGGTFEWDDTGSYAFASGVTYHWIAFGS